MPVAATPKPKAPLLAKGERLMRSAVYCRAETSAGLKAPNGESYDVRIVASTGRVARDGGIIEAAAWSKDLVRYIANPVVQWCHDYEEPPVATCVYVAVDPANGVLDAYWRFLTGISDDEWDRFAGRLKALYAVKGLNACSVGFIVHEYRDPTTEEKLLAMQKGEPEPYWVAVRAELLEQSAVPVPSDPYALAVDRAIGDAKKKGMKVEELETRWAAAKVKREAEIDCPACGQDIPAASIVCPFCGAKVPANAPVEAPDGDEGRAAKVVPCANCLQDVTPTKDGMCPKCGAVIQNLDGKKAAEPSEERLACVEAAITDLAAGIAALRGLLDAFVTRMDAFETARTATDTTDAALEARIASWMSEGERAVATITDTPSVPDHRAITDSVTRAFDAHLTPKIDLMLQRRLGLPPASTH